MKILNTLFVILGVIFLILILIGTYLFITDPWNIKPFIFGSDFKIETTQNNTTDATTTSTSTSNSTDTKIVLSAKQKETLTALGIDPVVVPASITATQETCLRTKLGTARLAELLAGDSPTAIDFVNAKSCI
jgi:hypothetical protein